MTPSGNVSPHSDVEPNTNTPRRFQHRKLRLERKASRTLLDALDA